MTQIAHDIDKAAKSADWTMALESSAAAIRRDIADALFRTGGGHYGGSFSAVELLVTLYARHLRIERGNLDDPHRDRFILSKGHAAIALYAVLRHHGLIDASLASYASLGSPLEGHPDMTAMPGIDWSTGSLGQGLSAALGMAIGLRRFDSRIWVMLGDGECQEGQVWEAAMLAGLAKPGNLHAIVDVNRRQEYGWHLATEYAQQIDPVPDMAAKWRAFGWEVIECDGSDVVAIDAACRDATGCERPSVILAQTRKGRGSRLTEADPARFHCADVSDAEHAAIMADLALP